MKDFGGGSSLGVGGLRVIKGVGGLRVIKNKVSKNLGGGGVTDFFGGGGGGGGLPPQNGPAGNPATFVREYGAKVKREVGKDGQCGRIKGVEEWKKRKLPVLMRHSEFPLFERKQS